MNEPLYVEAARELAERGLRQGGMDDRARLTFLFRLATSRAPAAAELDALTAGLADVRARFQGDIEAAKSLISVGETQADGTMDPAELAAWTLVGNTLLNLDEVVTKG